MIDYNQAFRDYLAQNGNKKNGDVKRIIMIMEAALSNETIKNTLYLSVGLCATSFLFKNILDFLNERYRITCEAKLDDELLKMSENYKEEE